MRLHYNTMSMNAFKNYNEASKANSKAINRISSGSKINSAKDNPNKIGQSEHLKLQIRGLQAAQKNVQDGVSMMQTVDGALSGVSESLLRMRELTIQAGSGANTSEDIANIQKEIDQIKNGINDLANNTEFNGVKLIGNKEVIDNKVPNYVHTVSGANAGETIAIPKFNININVLGDKDGNTIKDLDLTNWDIDKALNIIDQSMDSISSMQSKYGALENRFSALATNYDDNNLMLNRAQSNIEGADIAKEMMEFTRTNILLEVGNAMIAQTNEIPNEAIRILEITR